VDRELIYIGQTSSLDDRIRTHSAKLLNGIDRDRILVKYLRIEDESERYEFENELIRKYRPTANKLIVGGMWLNRCKTTITDEEIRQISDYIKID
jgi:predicted GIY-YIG superfamily endonuclease